MGLFHRRAVLHAHAGLELIFGGKVESTYLVVDTDNGGYAHTGLVGHQAHSLAVGLQGLQTGLGALQLGLGSLSLGQLGGQGFRNRHTGCFILGDAGFQLGNAFRVLHDAAGYPGIGIVEESTEGNGTGSGVHHDVAESGLVGGGSVEQAGSTIYREVLGHLIGGAKGETEVVLLAAHVAVYIVAGGAKRLQRTGNGCHGALERADAVGELALAAAAGHGNTGLKAPFAFVVGSLERRNDGGHGLALEFFDGLAVIPHAQRKVGVGGRDGACLSGILPVETYMETFVEEDDAGWVGIHTVESDGRIAGRIAQEVNALIGVG